MRGYHTLGEIEASIDMLEIKCTRCDRHGRLKTSRLIAKHGRQIGLPDLGSKLTSDCPKKDGTVYERCSPYFPQLTKLVR